MNEDFSDVINKFSEILKEKNIDLGSISGEENQPESEPDNDFSLDIETILKIKNIMNNVNKSKDSPRNKLLNSLKPYLESNKKEKLEQYMKIANLLSVLENIDTNNNLKFAESHYDFVLIITLFLLLF